MGLFTLGIEEEFQTIDPETRELKDSRRRPHYPARAYQAGNAPSRSRDGDEHMYEHPRSPSGGNLFTPKAAGTSREPRLKSSGGGYAPLFRLAAPVDHGR